MNYNFLVLGGDGMQGKITIKDLLQNNHTVFIADLYKDTLGKILENPNTAFEFIDLKDTKATVELIKKVDPKVVINCAEGDWNKNVYEACLETNKHVIDLGSDIPMTEEQIAMHEHFKKQNLIAITGCGSTPGINNILLHYAHTQLDTLDTIEVGFAWDSNIKKFVVPFSIQSVIEEFTEPAGIIENTELKEVIPMNTIEEREFREIGKQKCFIVRHPETYTFYIYNKKDGLKNVRFYAGFPEHSFNAITNFINTGFGSKEAVRIEGAKVTPVNFLTQVLKKLKIPEGYTEKENLWVSVSGTKDNKPKTILMECIVNTLPGWEDAGCNIDTGMPASIIAQMILNNKIPERGSYPPGPVVPSEEFFKELSKRSMKIFQDGVQIN